MPQDEPRPPDDAGRPIFIVGCTGAGTSLVRAMLDAHERIAVAPPTGFMRAVAAQRFVPFCPFGAAWHRRLGVSDDEFDGALRDFYAGLFARHAQLAGKARWGDSTPSHVWHADAIVRLFPGASFVGVVRHPMATAASNALRLGHGPKRAATDYARTTTELVRHATRLGERFQLVRYEDVVADPETTMGELLRRLGEPSSARVTAERPDGARVTRWTEALDEAARDVVSDHAGAVGRFLGYAAGDPLPVDPLGPGAVLDGTGVAERLARFGELDLRTPLPVPVAERPLDPRTLAVAPVPPNPGSRPRVVPRAAPRRGPVRRAASPVVRRIPVPVKRRVLVSLRRFRGAR